MAKNNNGSNGHLTAAEAYAKKVAPIVDHLNDTCSKYGISNVMAFAIPESATTGNVIASLTPDHNGRVPPEFAVVLNYLKGDTGALPPSH